MPDHDELVDLVDLGANDGEVAAVFRRTFCTDEICSKRAKILGICPGLLKFLIP